MSAVSLLCRFLSLPINILSILILEYFYFTNLNLQKLQLNCLVSCLPAAAHPTCKLYMKPLIKIISFVVFAMLLGLACCQEEAVQADASEKVAAPDAHASSQPKVAQRQNEDNIDGNPTQNLPPAPSTPSQQPSGEASPSLETQDSSRIDAEESERNRQAELEIQRARQRQIEADESQKSGSMTEQQRQEFERKLAEESRLMYQRIKKEMEDKKREEEEEAKRLAEESKPTKSQELKTKEYQDLKTTAEKFKGLKNQLFNTYLFDMDTSASEDFKITIPIDQQVLFTSKIYSNENGVFNRPSDVENEEPLWVYIFENNTKIVHQSSYYFVAAGEFQGKANTTYLIRFVNHGSHRLVELNLIMLLEQNHVYDILTVQDVADHADRIETVKREIYSRLDSLQTKALLENENRKKLTEGISKYFFYSIGEILVIGILCFMQIEFVQKLLVRTSVV